MILPLVPPRFPEKLQGLGFRVPLKGSIRITIRELQMSLPY